MLKYWAYDRFDVYIFLEEILNLLNKISYTELKNQLAYSLDKHGPSETKAIRINNKPFVRKTLRKTIMKRLSLKNNENISNDLNIRKSYKKQHNFTVNLWNT